MNQKTNKRHIPTKKDMPKQQPDGKFIPKYTEDVVNKLADELLVWMNEKNDRNEYINYWVKDFCIQKGINRQRVTEWCSKFPYWTDIYMLCKDMQESRIVKLGLRGNPIMPIFLLKNVAGYRDTPKESGLSDNEIDLLKNEAVKIMVDNA